MIKNLVLAGAGVKGISYIGVLKALRELQLFENIKNICAVSSGSIAGLCFFLEMSYSSIEKIIFEIMNYETIRSDTTVNIVNILKSYGIESGDNIIKIIGVILEKKTNNRNCTFKDLKKLYPDKKICIVGTNISNNKMEYFSIDTTPDMKIIKAIRISISVPFLFTSVTHNTDIYVDGGISCNFPMDYFKDDLKNTLGVCISSPNYISDVDNITTYFGRIIRILMDTNDTYIKTRYYKNIIEIIVDYDYTSINFDKKKREYLLDCGYRQTLINIKQTIFNPEIIIKKTLNNIIDEVEKIMLYNNI
uniref:PNPLA domain-containing protein n=1 Tax=viral metagenome TaxID=1070528 RepID=A0A6C0B5H6_9ZZZZ